ncbi:MAG: alpha/beta hydrolase [Amaricoccus sp.]
MSWQRITLDLWLRAVEKPRLARARSVTAARAQMERTAAHFAPRGPVAVAAVLGRLPALRMIGTAEATILWLHGGAFVAGSPRTHLRLVAELARRAGVGAVLPDYRLAPEHPFPAAVEDARAAWEGLLAEGMPPGRIALGGDSAGGGLAFALLGEIVAGGGPLPAGVLAFSPWADLTLAGPSLRRLGRRDAFLPVERLAEVRDAYLAGADPRDPRASPHLARFVGGPPALIQASRAEILLDDARAMAARLEADGVDVTLELDRGLPHVWQAFHGWLPEADAALGRAAAFLRRCLKIA